MSSLETKPVPSGSKKTSSGKTESWRSRSQTETTTSTGASSDKWRSNKQTMEKSSHFNILDDWEPNRGGMATHIEFIHQSMMDLATGIEKINSIDNKIQTISDQLTIMENHLIRVERKQESLQQVFEDLKQNQNSLYEGQQTMLEKRLENKIDCSVERLSVDENEKTTVDEKCATEEYVQKLLSDTISDTNIEFQSMLSENIDDVISTLKQVEEKLKKKIEDSKVELSATFETESEVCRNIYINEMMNQINSLKGKGSSVRYVGKKETQGISRLSSMLPSFGEDVPPPPSTSKKFAGVTVISKEE
jgi:uncharacterized phage infection (PIP) family protein YhgE